jgi:hypothetical protein
MIKTHYDSLIDKHKEKFGMGDTITEESITLELIVRELSSAIELSYGETKIRLLLLGYEEIKSLHNADEIPPLVKHTYNIPLSDAAKEYHSNVRFKQFVDSGLFAFAGEHIVIAGDRYVEHRGRNSKLTPYATKHLDECALWFGQAEFNEDKYGEESGSLRNEYQKLHLFDPDARNNEIFDKAKALSAVETAVYDYHANRAVVRQSFHELFNVIYKKQKWNSAIFKERTLLDDAIHSRLVHKQDYKPSKRTVLTIAVGAGLDIKTADDLLVSAGYAFDGSLRDDTYCFVLMEFSGCPIDEVNEVLTKCGVPTLGVMNYKTPTST